MIHRSQYAGRCAALALPEDPQAIHSRMHSMQSRSLQAVGTDCYSLPQSAPSAHLQRACPAARSPWLSWWADLAFAEAASKPMMKDPSMFEARSGKYAPRLLCCSPAFSTKFSQLYSSCVGWDGIWLALCNLILAERRTNLWR